MVWRPEGLSYYNVSQSDLINGKSDPQSQVKIRSVSNLGYPAVASNNGGGVYANIPTTDGNGIYWGDDGVGIKLVYPDGSQDVFGLSANIIYTPSPPRSDTFLGPGTSSERLFLTQRIDPQGRITKIGYELFPLTNYPSGVWIDYLRPRYVVDPDGRTSTFFYYTNTSSRPVYSAWQLSEIDDPYGRKASFTYTNLYVGMTVPRSIVDAAGLSNSFAYQGRNGWITNLATPYGNTTFSYYQTLDPNATEPDCSLQRAIYVTEPTGAKQLYYYLHYNSTMAGAGVSPTLPGQVFDNGTSGGEHSPLTYRNTFHWGRRQFTTLSQSPLILSGMDLPDALASLSPEDYNKAELRHWMLSSVGDSITESLSSERDPSPDVTGQILGLQTWYNYTGKPSPEEMGTDPQISCIARLLPDNTSQYTTYNYYPSFPSGNGFVSDNESTYSKPDGTIGTLVTTFTYSTNNIDLIRISNSAGQYVNYGYNGSHQITSVTNALNQVTTLSWNPNLTGVQWPSGQSVSLSYGSADNGRLSQISWSPSGRSFTVNSYSAGLPASVTDDRGLTVNNTWDGLNRLTGTVFPDNTTISNVYYRLDLVANKDRLNNWTYYSFDGLQHLTAVTNANNAVTSYSWCGCGSLTGILDPLNNSTSLNYDNQGNLTNVVFPDYSSVTWQFDLAGRMTNAFDGAGRALRVSYNNQGLPTTITGTAGTLRSVIYDALDRPVSVTDANGVTVSNTFDAIGELVKRTWPDGISEGFGWSAAGLVVYTNRDQKVTRYGLDAAGRVTSVTNANQEVIQAGYDSLDNLISLTDGLSHSRNWQYNEYGWLTNKVDGLARNAFRFA